MKAKNEKTTKKKTSKKAAQSAKVVEPKASATIAQSSRSSHDAVQNEAQDEVKAEIREAARILKSGGSKKRERRKAASVMSTLGSRKGGLNRAQNLSPEKRREIATMGGLARQAKARERATENLIEGK